MTTKTARLSKDREGSHSVETQIRDCQRLAELKGFTVVDTFTDVDVSGSTDDRAGLKEMRSRLAEVDAVVFWKMDRLARSSLHFATIIAEAEVAEVALVSATEPMDMSTPMGKATATIIAAIAELDRDNIIARTTAGIRTAQRSGKHAGGSVPSGWMVDAAKRMVLDPRTAPQMQEAVADVISGRPLLPIAAKVGLSQSGLKRWLRSRRLIGQLVTKPRGSKGSGTIVRDDRGMPIVGCEPLLDDNTFRELQAELDKRAELDIRQTASPHALLAGTIHCAACGSNLHRANNGAGVKSYRCQGTGCTQRTSIASEAVEEYVTGVLMERYGDVQLRRRVVTSGDPAREERLHLEGIQADLDEELLKGVLPASAYARATASLETRLADLENAQEDIIEFLDLGVSIAEDWAESDTDERRSMLEKWVEVRIARGVRGRRGFDRDRVELIFKPARIGEITLKLPDGTVIG